MEPLSDRLERHVRTLSGPRHWRTSRHGLRRAEDYVELQLKSMGLVVQRQPFTFQGESFENLVATVGGSRPGGQRLLVGAHLDTVRGSPGANDNGSGLAGLIEVARDLVEEPLDVSVDIVAFQLEEWQGRTYRVGSRHFVKKARSESHRYEGAFVYDMIGCKRTDPGSQLIPKIVSWMGFPTTGDFIAVLGDWKSRRMVSTFKDAARVASPGLAVTGLSVPLRGWPVWHTRRSDNASFWSGGIPSVMITDTGNLRNPRYHRPTDVPDYLDYQFMAEVVAATIRAVRVSGAALE